MLYNYLAIKMKLIKDLNNTSIDNIFNSLSDFVTPDCEIAIILGNKSGTITTSQNAKYNYIPDGIQNQISLFYQKKTGLYTKKEFQLYFHSHDIIEKLSFNSKMICIVFNESFCDIEFSYGTDNKIVVPKNSNFMIQFDKSDKYISVEYINKRFSQFNSGLRYFYTPHKSIFRKYL
jgi:hypothetical protein